MTRPTIRAKELLAAKGIRATTHRLEVLEAVLDAGRTITAPELETELHGCMNRVTLYRALDLLAESGVLLRSSGSGRASQYCLGRGHGHFHCRRCGRTQCLDLENGALTPEALNALLPGKVEQVDLRVDGLCEDCMKG